VQKRKSEKKLHLRPAAKGDIPYIIHANQQIERERAELTEEALLRDVFCASPKAYALILESGSRAVGMTFYSFAYWASDGLILWVSQMYIEPQFRDARGARLLRNGLLDEAARRGSRYMVWATHNSADRTNRLWKRTGAKNLSEDYSFWVMSISATGGQE
jgi:GNAT superfamily N-acetyltransferase